MARFAFLLLMWWITNATMFSRLGETLDQAEARYGLEKQPKGPKLTGTLLEGSREVLFEFEGWRIRCALLQATDGKFYIVREEYTKIWNGDVMKKGGSPQIRDFERDAVFQAEGGGWSSKTLAELGPDVMSSISKQLAQSLGFSKVWIRPDGALARINVGDVSVVLDLPQALKYEAQLKGIQDREQREKAQRLVQPAGR